MLAWILQSSGRDPTVYMGGEMVDSGCVGRGGRDPLLVMETCEYRRGFLHQRPDLAVILNMEPDHFDSYPVTEALTTAFREFAGRIPDSGRLVLASSIATVLEPILTEATRETFGDNASATWSLEWAEPDEKGALARRGSSLIGHVCLSVPGRHNQLNALAAAALASYLDISPKDSLHAVASFPGIRRRFERKIVRGGAIAIDDYAHHPTAVRASLETARRAFPGRRIRAVFQPHQVSRTERLMREFAEALILADEVVILPVFAAREGDAARQCAVAELLAAEVRGLGGDARFEDSLDPIRHSLDDAGETAVVLTIGAGDIDQVYHADA
jgi:UDP-N-acetylmuramate--alanine ligase